MPKIHRLAPHEAQKIAAGEVVERPANIVKELIENSIDAGATHISVYIEHGGKDLIRIVDNGCGMSLDDAYLCFEHHATSKITNVHDLETITTFGFRGEALSSIAAVSKTVLITKEPEAEQAINLELENGTITNQSFVSANSGTDIAIRDIFYNVPARKKFLKSDDTEWRAIVQLFNAFCLDYLNIHFKMFHNDIAHANCPPTNDIMTRMTQLWEHTFSSNMIPVSAFSNQGTLKISGAISNHQYMRYDRNNIFFFVNKRWVKQQKLSSALLKGYLNVLPPARYPAACIFIEVDTTQVDINIHPRKEEVQFLHPRIVEQLLQQAVKQALETNLSNQLKKPVTFSPATEVIRSSMSTMHGLNFEPIYKIQQSAQNNASLKAIERDPFSDQIDIATNNILEKSLDAQSLETQVHDFSEYEKSNAVFNHNTSELFLHSEQATPLPLNHGNMQEHSFNPAFAPIAREKNYTFIGQLKKTYLLLEKDEGLYVVDQHAAHERILYELFSKRFDDIATVNLLFPHIITLKSEDVALLEPHCQLFANNGIELEIFSDTQVVIKSTPVHLKNQSLDDLVQMVISWITQTESSNQAQFFKVINEKLHAQMACKAAVKAGDSLTQEQIDQLLDDLEKTDNRFTCPHGRPTGWLLSSYEIEKKFKRKA